MNRGVSSSASSTAPVPARTRPCRRCSGRVSPSPMRLWSWASGSGRAHAAVAQRHQAALGPVQALLEHDRPARRPADDRRLGRRRVGRHDDALAGGQPVELDDDGAAELVPPGQMPRRPTSLRTNAGDGRPSCAASARVNPLELSSRASAAVGPKHGTPSGRAAVGDAGRQRRLRPGDHQIRRRRSPTWSPSSAVMVTSWPSRSAGPRRSPPRDRPPPTTTTCITPARPRSSAWAGPRRPRSGTRR